MAEKNPLLVMLQALVNIRDNAQSLGVDGVQREAADALKNMREPVRA